jgi:predicted anti-sigma-YlaC factor YlaD
MLRDAQHVDHLLDDYYDNELASAARRRVDVHLKECPSCRAELEQRSRLSGLLAEYSVPDAFSSAEVFGAQVALRLSGRVRERSRYRGAAWHIVPLLLLCGVVALQVLLALSGTLVAGARFAGWLGVDVGSLPALAGLAWPELGTLYGYSWPSLLAAFIVSLMAGLYLGSLIVFVPYVGWVSALWRSTRADPAPGANSQVELQV